MDFVRFFFLGLIISSCAKMGYLADQGLGQLDLIINARENQKVLEDPTVSVGDKEKIRKIIEYKAYFYRYWDRKETKHYSKTYFLKNEAVTHLLIVSSIDRIEAKKECFWPVGCFPYLGFFDYKDAQKWASTLEGENFTYIRPVYAYSTLGKLNDPILSSFFRFDDRDLAELVFHELFHTIYFLKNEVKFNENLANFIGKQMADEYFHDNEAKTAEREKASIVSEKLNREITRLVHQFQEILKLNPPRSKHEAEEVLSAYLSNNFLPQLSAKCRELEISQCNPLKGQWNNASMAAYLTYEDMREKIVSLAKGKSLRELINTIENLQKLFEESADKGSFSDYLFQGQSL